MRANDLGHEPEALNTWTQAWGLCFRDTTLLWRALTHTSYWNENPGAGPGNNERLEFLGDAVGDFVAAEFLYQRFPDWQEGQLTDWRANLVRTESLGAFAARIELGQHLRLGRGEERSGGRTRVSLLADAFEALLGALYLDQGLEVVRRFLQPFLESQIGTLLAQARLRDAKSRLQEWTQASMHAPPTYITVRELGPDHAKQFTVHVLIQGQVVGEGTGHSKQAAEQAAAQAALDAVPAAL